MKNDVYLCECGCKLNFDGVNGKREYYIKCGNQTYMYNTHFCPMCGIELSTTPEIELKYEYWLNGIIKEFKEDSKEPLTKEEIRILSNILKSQISLIEGTIKLEEYNNTEPDHYDEIIGSVIVLSSGVVSKNIPFRTPEQANELFIQEIKNMKGIDIFLDCNYDFSDDLDNGYFDHPNGKDSICIVWF